METDDDAHNEKEKKAAKERRIVLQNRSDYESGETDYFSKNSDAGEGEGEDAGESQAGGGNNLLPEDHEDEDDDHDDHDHVRYKIMSPLDMADITNISNLMYLRKIVVKMYREPAMNG